jgi:hypothetical protein
LTSQLDHSLGTDKPGEFRCERCGARCTQSPTKDLAYGHREGCPDRPDHFGWADGDTYEPEEDSVAVNEQLSTYGGESA